jgi:hypothetical protein
MRAHYFGGVLRLLGYGNLNSAVKKVRREEAARRIARRSHGRFASGGGADQSLGGAGAAWQDGRRTPPCRRREKPKPKTAERASLTEWRNWAAKRKVAGQI